MYNGSKEKMHKEAALHYDNQLRNQIWQAIQTSPRISQDIKRKGIDLLNNEHTTPYQLQQWANNAGIGNSKNPAPNAQQNVAVQDQQKIQALDNWAAVYGQEDRMVYYDAAATDGFKIVLPGLDLASMIPQHELSVLQKGMGSTMKQSPEGVRLLSNPQVWKRFQSLEYVWMPRQGMTLFDPMACVVGKDGSVYHLNPNRDFGSYYKEGDAPNEKGEYPEYELSDIERGSKKSTVSQLANKDKTPLEGQEWDQKFKAPFNKRIGATVQPVNFRTKSYGEKTMALILEIDPHAEIFHGTSPEDDITQFCQGKFGQNFFIDTRGKVTILLNTSVRGESPDPSVINVTDKAVMMISNLIDWLKVQGFDTSAVNAAMQPYDKKNRLERAVERIVSKRHSAPLSDQEIKLALHRNDSKSMKEAMANEGQNLNSDDPAQQFQFIDYMKKRLMDLYPHGFNNTIFPDEMKQKQAEAIALGITRQSVVMADQPGSGKTFMSTATADYYSKMMEKKTDGVVPQILVISPSGLVPQNWTTRFSPWQPKKDGEQPDPNVQKNVNGKWYNMQPSAPRQFASPDMQMNISTGEDGNPQVADNDIQVITQWGQQVDPNKRWVIMNYNLFTDVGDPRVIEEAKVDARAQYQNEQDPTRKVGLKKAYDGYVQKQKLAVERFKKINALKSTIKSGNFCCVMLDESQMVKNDNSRTRHVADAIREIPKRIAMTGTPADDNPADLYGQLELINHPILWRKDPSEPTVPKKIDKTVFAQQFFGGFGLKNTPIDVEAFKSSIPQRVQDTIKFLDMLADFFVRREKEDINPLINDKVSHKNVIHKTRDDNGNEIAIDEGSYPAIQEAGLLAAADRKAKKAKLKGEDITSDIDAAAQDKIDADDQQDFDTSDIQDLGDDQDSIEIDGITISPAERQAALGKLMANPAEKQGAILRHVAELKVPETVTQAINALKSPPNFVPPKVGEEVVACDQNGQVISNSLGVLQKFDVNISGGHFNKKRQVIAQVLQNGEVKAYPREQIVPAKPQYEQKKVFVITKYVDVARKIKQQIEAEMGQGVVDLVTGQDADEGQRTEITEAFKKPETPLRCLIMTMKLGSVGFNFQVADTAIFNDLSWNPSENEQASDRVYRITSPRKVNVIYNTLGVGEDAQMYSMIEAKDASNKKIQSCIKLAYNLKRELLANPTNYQAQMTEAATTFLQELAESMRQHQEAKKLRGTANRRSKNADPEPVQMQQTQPQMPQPVAAKGNWYNVFKIATRAFRLKW